MLPMLFVQHSVCYQMLKETIIFQIKNIVPGLPWWHSG